MPPLCSCCDSMEERRCNRILFPWFDQPPLIGTLRQRVFNMQLRPDQLHDWYQRYQESIPLQPLYRTVNRGVNVTLWWLLTLLLKYGYIYRKSTLSQRSWLCKDNQMKAWIFNGKLTKNSDSTSRELTPLIGEGQVYQGEKLFNLGFSSIADALVTAPTETTPKTAIDPKTPFFHLRMSKLLVKWFWLAGAVTSTLVVPSPNLTYVLSSKWRSFWIPLIPYLFDGADTSFSRNILVRQKRNSKEKVYKIVTNCNGNNTMFMRNLG